MTPPKLACGVRWLLEHAIHQHRKRFYGDDPLRFELHPETVCALASELGLHWYYCRDNDGGMHYHGIEIVVTRRASEPRMITCRNEVEPL